MKVLVVGSGGREHALVWKLAQSPQVDELYCAPGNPGMVGLATCLDIAMDDLPGLLTFASTNKIDLTVVGPELPLTLGITDLFEKEGLLVAGPSRYTAQLEGSKSFAKNLMRRFGIPTADYQVFEDPQEAKTYIQLADRPLVVKADGLAAGKGVILCQTSEEAQKACEDIMVKRIYGDAGRKVVIEELLTGEEVSFLAFTDGQTIVPMPSSQDHKAVGDGDTGPNTGGMGAYSPTLALSAEMNERVLHQVIHPLVEGLAREGNPFKGILYAGLMIGPGGSIKVLEFNVRFGDPEGQALMLRLDSDLAEILYLLAKKNLQRAEVVWSRKASVCVVMSSQGYPGSYSTGLPISGLTKAEKYGGIVFHAGTMAKNDQILCIECLV